MSFYKILLVGCGGFFGSIARYITAQTIDSRLNAVFPYGTLAVNIAGSLILGIIFGIFSQKSGDWTNVKLLLITGFCGGFTTFSAFAFENLQLFQQRLVGTALLYIITSLVFGLLAVWVGVAIGRALE